MTIANRDDYLAAGLKYFPMSWRTADSVKVLVLFSLMFYMASIALYFMGGFAWLYLVLANLLGIMIIYTSLRLVVSSTSQNAWRLYKLSAFPYLGLIFLTMCLDIWLVS